MEDLYTIVWLEVMHYKVKEGHSMISYAIYNIIGIDRHGYKTLLEMYVSQNEGANLWLSVLTDLQNRGGVKDIIIACIDYPNGFPTAINTVFPQTEIQTCVVNQIRNSLEYVASKDQKAFMADLKPVYKAPHLNRQNLEWRSGG